MVHWFWLKASCARRRVSDGNLGVEALLCATRFHSQFPAKGFGDLAQVRARGNSCINWHNDDRRISSARYLRLAQRHGGEGRDIPRLRDEFYQQARAQYTRSWTPHASITNPMTVVTTTIESEAMSGSVIGNYDNPWANVLSGRQ